uniref:TLC domain-containing protein 2 (Trinotate prediction) n=1 Tax=Myxobolus squamalis TaxID=59785 RepID=A0A6B2G2M0_MYXSQ
MIFFKNNFMYHTLSISTGYFIADTYDHLTLEKIIQNWEILLHHATVLTTFSISLIHKKYLGFAMFSLLIEINTVFLHVYRIMKILGNSPKSMPYRMNLCFIDATFIPVRTFIPIYMIYFVYQSRALIPFSHFFVSTFGTLIMLIINFFLLMRVIKINYPEYYGKDEKLI